jgi:spore coat protein A, manganese oxidase
MATKVYSRCFSILFVIALTTNLVAQQVPTITGPLNSVTGLPATLGPGITTAVYSTETGMTNYHWTVSLQGSITEGQGSESITVRWNNPTSQQTVSVTYSENTAGVPTVLIINYYPFLSAIDPATVKQFVDPMPHFAAGLRVNAKNGGNLVIKTFPVRQVALSKGTEVSGGIIGDPSTPDAGMGNYAGYGISTDDGATFPVKMWPAQSIETRQGKPLTVKYENGLNGITYDHFNILADQTLMMNGYQLTGDPLTEPYRGDIPMVVHLHGGEMPSGSDGGPSAWFMPGFTQTGPTFKFNQSSSSYYPNAQEATTLWYHPHDDGLTRINVYTGLAGYYILRGDNEEAAKFPGWSQDDLVREKTPTGDKYAPTFNGANAYLPEVEIAIQDRMFNVAGGLYWPVDPPNPEIHPFWTPEFVGDIMTVNGKSWPYLSVAPRKYRFRMLEGCNARFLDMWLAVLDANGDPAGFGPKFTIIGGEGGLLAAPETIDPALGQTLLMAPGQRYDVIVDFTGFAPGTTFTLMNKAGAPYPGGDPVIPGITDRIMQFIVNGELVSAANPAVTGTDKSLIPANLRPVSPLVKLTNFAGGTNVTPDVHRQIILNEVSADGGPAAVLINNTYFDAALSINPDDPYRAGGPSEFQLEGTTEKFEVINVSADAHPIHIHLLQWQLVSRRPIDDVAYMDAYAAAWQEQHPGVSEFPAGLGYPGGAGTPFPYSRLNGDNAIGGNPEVSPFFTGPAVPANPEERGWKDDIIVMPGEVTTFMVRVAPTEVPLNATPKQLLFPFDPSEGPGFVWHCHIVDHEDMSMMRPLMIIPSALRYPQITTQPAAVNACPGTAYVTFSVAATSSTTISYQWQVSSDNGGTWTPLANDQVYSGVTSSTLKINSVTSSLDGNQYRVLLTNFDGTTISNPALFTFGNCGVSGTVKYNNSAKDPLGGVTVSVGGKTAITDASGAFTISGVSSGTQPVVVTYNAPVGGINATDAGSVNYWIRRPVVIPNVKFLSGDVNKDNGISKSDADGIQSNFVYNSGFARGPWVFWNAIGSGLVNPPSFTVNISNSSETQLEILGMCTGDFNGSFDPDLTGNGNSNVLLTQSGNTLTFPASKLFELPLIAASDMKVGALSLILNIPSRLVKVMAVRMVNWSAGLTYKVTGDELRIAWNNTTPVNVLAGQKLVIITLTSNLAFTPNETLSIGLVPNLLNELASFDFSPILNAVLKADDVKITYGEDIKLVMTPNPAQSYTIATYTLPVSGKVNLGIFNSLGVQVRSLVVNSYRDAGIYSVSSNISSLQNGTYVVKITLQTDQILMTKTTQLIKN